MSNIADKVVVITGASSGIGESAARLLAAAGAKVVMGARRTDRMEKIAAEIRKAGGAAEFRATDVTKRGDVQALVDAALKSFGRVDVMVNNAGLMANSPLEALLVDEWDRMIDLNIKGVLYGIAAALPHMLARGSGQIINVASIAGLVVFAGATPYCATKFAVRAISEGLRKEVGSKVRVTIISPGAIDTELADHISHGPTKEMMGPILSLAIPADSIGRAIVYAIGEPDDVDVNEIVIRPTAQEL